MKAFMRPKRVRESKREHSRAQEEPKIFMFQHKSEIFKLLGCLLGGNYLEMHHLLLSATFKTT